MFCHPVIITKSEQSVVSILDVESVRCVYIYNILEEDGAFNDGSWCLVLLNGKLLIGRDYYYCQQWDQWVILLWWDLGPSVPQQTIEKLHFRSRPAAGQAWVYSFFG